MSSRWNLLQVACLASVYSEVASLLHGVIPVISIPVLETYDVTLIFNILTFEREIV